MANLPTSGLDWNLKGEPANVQPLDKIITRITSTDSATFQMKKNRKKS